MRNSNIIHDVCESSKTLEELFVIISDVYTGLKERPWHEQILPVNRLGKFNKYSTSASSPPNQSDANKY